MINTVTAIFMLIFIYISLYIFFKLICIFVLDHGESVMLAACDAIKRNDSRERATPR